MGYKTKFSKNTAKFNNRDISPNLLKFSAIFFIVSGILLFFLGLLLALVSISDIFFSALGILFVLWGIKCRKKLKSSKNKQPNITNVNTSFSEEQIFFSNEQEINSEEQGYAEEDSSFDSLIKIETRCIDIEDKQIKELSRLDFEKPTGTLGCFLNYSYYQVSGIDKEGIKCSRKLTGMSEQHAIQKIIKRGFSAPFEAKIIEFEPPTEPQLECLRRNIEIIPEGLTKDDASCMISRIVGEDDLESPEQWLVNLANGFKIEFSAFIGAGGLFRNVIYQPNNRNRAALFVYGVRQDLRGSSFENMLDDPEIDNIYSYADKIISDSALLRSLKGRTADDYLHPHRGTAIYKASAAMLVGATI